MFSFFFQSDVFKIHYLMLSLLYFKSVALVFHGMNYYFIQQEGTHEEVSLSRRSASLILYIKYREK